MELYRPGEFSSNNQIPPDGLHHLDEVRHVWLGAKLCRVLDLQEHWAPADSADPHSLFRAMYQQLTWWRGQLLPEVAGVGWSQAVAVEAEVGEGQVKDEEVTGRPQLLHPQVGHYWDEVQEKPKDG